jgi:hypothetical protein
MKIKYLFDIHIWMLIFDVNILSYVKRSVSS